MTPGLSVGDTAILRLRILATSDLHAHLFPFDYYADRRDDGVGLARAAGLIADLRAEVPNCLLFDNGDTLQGSPLGDAALAEIVPSGRPHPMVSAMNALGYDSVTLGNHDFDYGLAFTNSAMSAATYPIVLANARGRDGALLRPGHAVLQRDMADASGTVHRLRIGVIGVAPPQTTQWNGHVLAGDVVMEDILTAIRRELGALASQSADVVIVLAHSGKGLRDGGRPGAENVAAAIADLPGVDVVVAGHTHQVLPAADGRVAPDPDAPSLVQPGFYGSHLGVVDLTLGRASGAGWSVTHRDVQAMPVAPTRQAARAAFRRSLREYPGLRAQMAKDHRATRAFVSRPLGRLGTPIESYFSLLAPCPAMTLIADAQRAAALRLIKSEPALSGLPLVSAVAPFRAGGRGGPANYTDISAGPLLLRHAADLYIYPNSLALVRATGAQVRDWLERAAAAYCTVVPDPGAVHPQPLIDRRFASYNFDCLDGLDYKIDITQPARTSADGETYFGGPGRVRDLCLRDGTALTPETEVVIATNSYRAQGGGHFAAAASADLVVQTTQSIRDIVAQYITDMAAPLHPVARPIWRFAPMPPTRVLVETGPGALHYPDRIAALGLVDAGVSPDGFHKFTWTI
jgi:2',3'-cyclic-nucleotide 2'-phosphodiesterase/3'-nucleotidase